MNRKQKIIVSVTGIFIVLLILVGLTYAYFLTQISGNTNSKSISVTTANLVLDYGEETSEIKGITNAEPGYSVTKTFTATNNGNSEVDYVAVLESVTNELSRKQDLVYTLTCDVYNKTGFSLSSDGTVTGTKDNDVTCEGVEEIQFPSTTDVSIMVENRIQTTQVHVYKLVLTYKEAGVDQSDDMNKTFSAKVNLKDKESVNPYEIGTLAYDIYKNTKIYYGQYDFSKDYTYNEELTNSNYYNVSVYMQNFKSGLYKAEDDYGDTYYYRGANLNIPHVKIGGKIAKVVRINGNGTIRILFEYDTLASDVYGNDATYIGSTAQSVVENFATSVVSTYPNELIEISIFCNDTTSDSYNRLKNRGKPTFKCEGNSTKLDYLYSGLLSADEVIYSGAIIDGYVNGDGNLGTSYRLDSYEYNTFMTKGVRDGQQVMSTQMVLTVGTYAPSGNEYHYNVVMNLSSRVKIIKGEGSYSSPYELGV